MESSRDTYPTVTDRRAETTRRLVRQARSKARELVWETRFFALLGRTWQERLSVLKMVAKLYAARLMPFDTRRWETTIQVRGAKYVLGVRTSEVYIFSEIYEWRQYERHADFIPQKGWTVFDVGANVGVFTVKQAMQGADVYAFEPNPDSYGRLSKNVTLNRLADRVHLFQSALGDEPGMGTMHVFRGGTTGGVVVPAKEGASSAGAQVTITTLDRLVPSLQVSHIDLLKVDAEGAEVAVLQGAERTLETVRRIIVEYHSRELLRKVGEILARNGFLQELIVDYYPEDSAVGQEEVGILYARRPA